MVVLTEISIIKVRLLRFGAILWGPSILSLYMSLFNILIVIIY